MKATLTLNKPTLFWFIDGFVNISHLRWDGYRILVDEIYPQLTEEDRLEVYKYLTELSVLRFSEEDKSKIYGEYPKFEQAVARFNPDAQFMAVANDNITSYDVYKYNGLYYLRFDQPMANYSINKILGRVKQ